MNAPTRRARFAVASLLLVIGLSVAGCGGGNGDVTLTIGSPSVTEQVILGHIYAQALEEAGYKVKTDFNLLYSGEALEAVKQGRISGFTEHVSTLMELIYVPLENVPPDAQAAYAMAKQRLAKKGLTAFPPTPFDFTNVVGALRKTAEEHHLKKVSDLEGQSEDLTIAGVSGCHQAVNCVGGLERLYGLAFGGFKYKIGTETEPFKALETRFSDLAMLPNTDGRLFAEKGKFATLEEDKHLFPAGNALFVTTPEVVEEAGTDYEKTIVEAQKGLTLPVMRELNAKVEIEKKKPAEVADEYLKEAGYTG